MTAAEERHPLGGGRRSRAVVRRVANPVVMRLGLAGGRRSLWGVITVAGRRSGELRSNPVVPHVVGDTVLIPMSFGTDVQWVRNVLAARGGTLRYRGREWRLADPRLVSYGSAAARLPERLARSYERMRVAAFLELRVEAGW